MRYLQRYRRMRSALRNERGVAFPVVLFALIGVSVMVTGILLSSASELAVSGAHQDGTRSLYLAEEGLERYVADMAGNPALLQPGTFVRTGNPHDVSLTVAQVARTPSDTDTTTTYSITAAPVLPGGNLGRTVMAMINVIRTINTVPGPMIKINAAATFAGDVRIDGSVLLSGTQDKTLCALDTVKNSITSLENHTVTGGTSSRLPQGHEKLDMTTAQLRQRVMGDLTFDQLYQRADIKFPWKGIRLGGKVDFKGYGAEKSESKAPVATYLPTTTNYKLGSHQINPYKPAESHPYNWGCPWTTLGRTGCDWQWADTTFYPIIGVDAWDAANNRNGTVRLDGAHGQGLLVVMRSNLIIGSTFFFKGIILVEGELDINSSATIHGAIIGFNETDVHNDNEQHEFGSTVTIRYDQCVIDKINLGFSEGQENTTQLTTSISRPFGWMEVVR